MDTFVLILKIMALLFLPLIVAVFNLAIFYQDTSFFWDPAGAKKAAATIHNTVVYIVSFILWGVSTYLLYLWLF